MADIACTAIKVLLQILNKDKCVFGNNIDHLHVSARVYNICDHMVD